MTALQTLRNSLASGMARVFPQWWPTGSTKHNHYRDYGWPDQVDFNNFHRLYQRNGLATAAIDKTVAKTWETHPDLWETERPAESDAEAQIRRRFAKLRVWQAFMNVDRYGMVGAYSGAIILLADGQSLDQPVTRVPGGVDGLAGIIPAWEGQLSVADWDTDFNSPTYGQPKAYQFSEQIMDDKRQGPIRSVRIHPDRVVIWSEDGTVHGRSSLEPGYNDLIDAEKVKGAGGEGFWKSSRGAPMIESPEGMNIKDVMTAVGASDANELQEMLDAKVVDFQSGFDAALMLGGFTAKPLSVQLPQPKEFFNIAVMGFAASMQIPFRILLGNETGERASTEDAEEWAKVNMSRRTNLCIPALMDFVDRLVQWNIIPARDWTIGWDDLTEATQAEKIDRAGKMADINQKMGLDAPFTQDEVREVADYEPLTASDRGPGEMGELGEDELSEDIEDE